MTRPGSSRLCGVTLIELLVVILVTAILLTLMASFVIPIFEYSDAKRRAEMTDIADTALRRIGRDLQNALPNSVRITTSGGVTYLELLLVRTGGRYRADTGSSGGTACAADGGADPNVLHFAVADTCFKTLGNIPNNTQVTSTDYVVVYNLQSGTNNSADAYETGSATGGNKARITSLTPETNQDKIQFASNTFTFESPAQRFDIIEGPVTYACDPTASHNIVRYAGYDITTLQATPPTAGGVSSSVLVSNVYGCTFTYDANVVAQAEGLVTLAITLQSADLQGSPESVNLYNQVHVRNVP